MNTGFLLKNRWVPIAFAALVTLLAGTWASEPIAAFESRLGDRFWHLFVDKSEKREQRVVVIDIDEVSIDRYGAWPWPRERVARLLEILREQGISLRIIDIVFPESKPGDDRLVEELPKTPTVLAQILAIGAGQVMERGMLQGSMPQFVCSDTFPRANAAIGNTLELRAASAGHITPLLDNDGVVRRLPSVICYRDRAYATLSLAALTTAADLAPDYRLTPGRTWFDPPMYLTHPDLPGMSVPVGLGGELLLPWWLDRQSIISISAQDLMEGNVPEGILKGAWALVGASAFSIGDTVSTPLARAAGGVEVHAQLLSALLDGRIPYRPLGAIPIQIAWIIASALLLMAAGAVKGGIFRVYGPLLIGITLLTATLLLHVVLLQQTALWQPWALSGLFIAILSVLITTQGYWLSRLESALLFRNLSSYLPIHVAEEIAKQEPVGTLQARREQATVLYADLRNFSAWCDQLPADEVAALLHNFYTYASHIIDRHGGVVEEYVGDAVMGVWRGRSDDIRPLRAAENIIMTAERLYDAETGIDSLPPLAVGIGIERGEVLVGAFGPARRRNHTLLGRAVTTAIRLQAMTGELAQPIIFGENIAQNWKEEANVVSLGNFLLQNILQPAELFVPQTECIVPDQMELTVTASDS